MSDNGNFRRFAGACALLTTVLMLGNAATILGLARNPQALFDDPALLLSLGAGGARLFHISMVLDVLGYLALGPVVVFCSAWLKEQGQGPASLFTYAGLAYSLLGSIGGVVMDAVMGRMMVSYAAASLAEQQVLRSLAQYLSQAVAHGIWNPLEVLMISVWFLGIGPFLWRKNSGLAVVALVVGTLGLLDPVGWMLGSELALEIGAIGTVLIPVWTAWLGIELLRNARWVGSINGEDHAGQVQALA